MLNIYGYLTAWAIYLSAGTLCYILFYKATGFIRPKALANALRGIMIALIYTPWTIAPDEDLMAPAVIVILLDLITVGGESFIRALVPLTLALMLAIVVGLFWNLIRRKRN
ncbi:MAG TPA: hypothetical protein DEG76_01550 [Pseudohongiella sp.]|jgi:hypothetical protein|nr:hypothetical protein [Pseudohongiella sp.]MAY56508.1 hypothetical protein [Gammaproteobacteria bacterium]MBJ56383.1 hypothetical protein [Gammaproteobacteria bacterium]HBN15003.1 hypothetical protein [Pseudohongiella sp.]HBX36049.1 hypothetical protein [Pseudohongiella sp.]|tara:strand:- start:355 stop:687 length:333 start_codon:yes stop_codon:yes gene_type:complete